MTGAVEGRLAEAWVRVRSLHCPDAANLTRYKVFVCDGCPADWPCATAEIVYSKREIAAALAGTPPQTEDET